MICEKGHEGLEKLGEERFKRQTGVRDVMRATLARGFGVAVIEQNERKNYESINPVVDSATLGERQLAPEIPELKPK